MQSKFAGAGHAHVKRDTTQRHNDQSSNDEILSMQLLLGRLTSQERNP